MAVLHEQIDRVKELVGMKVEPTATNSLHENALRIAVSNQSTDIVDVLLDSEFVTNHPDFLETKTKSQETALHLACCFGNASIVRSLLQHGSSPMTKGAKGDTPVHVAVKSTNTNTEILHILLDADTNLHAKILDERNDDGLTPLMTAFLVRRLDHGIVLHSKGADVMSTTKSGRTMWHQMAHNPHPDMQKVLFKFIKRLSEEDLQRVHSSGIGKSHGTPLQAAVLAGNHKVIAKLLEIGADLDAKDAHGWTPRHCIRLSDDDGIRKMVLSGVFDSREVKFQGLTKLPSRWCETYKPDFIVLSQDGLVVECGEGMSLFLFFACW
jgi:ankyrin repeat protein